MTDQKTDTNSSSAKSAGALLRHAREQRGVHLAALASAIKVAPARLEALEADDYSGMPDTTFARALAQAVCRALKVDPAPVLTLMPESFHSRLERVDEGINAPFRERPGGLGDSTERAIWRHPVAWLVLALLLAAAAFVWWPRSAAIEATEGPPPGAEPLNGPRSTAGADPSAPAVLAPDPNASTDASAPGRADGGGSTATAQVSPGIGPASAAATGVAMANPAPAPASSLPILAVNGAGSPASAAGGGPQAASGGDAAEVRALQDTWVQVTDASGKVLIGRTLPAGESLTFNGSWPMKFRIGNVQGTELRFRGQALDLKTMTKDNTLSLSLPLAGSP